jgi:hypothetical protein
VGGAVVNKMGNGRLVVVDGGPGETTPVRTPSGERKNSKGLLCGPDAVGNFSFLPDGGCERSSVLISQALAKLQAAEGGAVWSGPHSRQRVHRAA